MNALAVIPARHAAQRFPGKPLATLWGKPMLQHVWERARRIEGLEAVIVATDDARIEHAARAWGAVVEMTSPECTSGTDRVAEVARRHPEARWVLNLQGDEPELDSAGVTRLVAGMRAEPEVRMATLAHRVRDVTTLASDHVVKLGLDANGFAIYFTRQWPPANSEASEVLRHIGVYGFRRELLLEFAGWPPGRLEREERLEQLRAMERGVKIRVYMSDHLAQGIDTPEQLAELEARGPQTE